MGGDIPPGPIISLEGPALLGLMQVLNGVAAAVQAELLKIRGASHAALLELQQKQSRLHDERERLKFVNKKCIKKTATLERASKEFECARGVLLRARAKNSAANTGNQKNKDCEFISIGENLCDS
ncbi:hypothetical protein M758_UG316900 [Ceratodon purpureus]|nr:hypothetical protein M758_UG316900 [Ceratodon purpureus]